MKKILVILIAIIGFGVSVNAQSVKFRTTQTVCSNSTSERIVLKTDATFEIWQNDRRVYTGTYTVQNSNEIILNVSNDGGTWRLSANISNGVLNWATFNDVRYSKNGCK